MTSSKEQSRKKLIDSILDIVRESGYKNASTKQIAQRAGMNEASVFRLFGSKRQLFLDAVYQKTISIRDIDMEKIRAGGDARMQIKLFLESCFDMYYRQMSIYRIFMLSSMEDGNDSEHQQMVYSKISEIIDAFATFLEEILKDNQLPLKNTRQIIDMLFSKMLILMLDLTYRESQGDDISADKIQFIESYSKFLYHYLGI